MFLAMFRPALNSLSFLPFYVQDVQNKMGPCIILELERYAKRNCVQALYNSRYMFPCIHFLPVSVILDSKIKNYI